MFTWRSCISSIILHITADSMLLNSSSKIDLKEDKLWVCISDTIPQRLQLAWLNIINACIKVDLSLVWANRISTPAKVDFVPTHQTSVLLFFFPPRPKKQSYYHFLQVVPEPQKSSLSSHVLSASERDAPAHPQCWLKQTPLYWILKDTRGEEQGASWKHRTNLLLKAQQNQSSLGEQTAVRQQSSDADHWRNLYIFNCFFFVIYK